MLIDKLTSYQVALYNFWNFIPVYELYCLSSALIYLLYMFGNFQEDKNVAHLTHVSEMEKKIETLARITTILKDVILNKVICFVLIFVHRCIFDFYVGLDAMSSCQIVMFHFLLSWILGMQQYTHKITMHYFCLVPLIFETIILLVDLM